MVGWHPLKFHRLKWKFHKKAHGRQPFLDGNVLSHAKYHLDFPGPRDILDILVFLEFWAFLDFCHFFWPICHSINWQTRNCCRREWIGLWLPELVLNICYLMRWMFISGEIECFWLVGLIVFGQMDGFLSDRRCIHTHLHTLVIQPEVLFHQFSLYLFCCLLVGPNDQRVWSSGLESRSSVGFG